MSKRRKRDIYGNRIWRHEQNSENHSNDSAEEQELRSLNWRDYVAISIASLETFLLPLVAFIVILVVLAIIFTHG